MHQRQTVALRRFIRQWGEDPDRQAMVAERLRALGIGVGAADLLERVLARAPLDGLDGDDTRRVISVLDQHLDETLEGLTTALESLPVVKVAGRKFDQARIARLDESEDEDNESNESIEIADDESSDQDSSEDRQFESVFDSVGRDSSIRLENSAGLWRSLVELHGPGISKGNIRSVSALINWVNVQGDSTGDGRVRAKKFPRQPWPKRLPWPRAGVRREQALMWPALWLSGETGLFPYSNGKDPSQRRRNRRIHELEDQRQQVEALMLETLMRAKEVDHD